MIKSVICMLAFISVAAVAHAHHGWSEYDNATTLNLTGVIKEAGYEHPHGHVRLETPGKVWLVVLAPPSLFFVLVTMGAPWEMMGAMYAAVAAAFRGAVLEA